MSVFHQLAAELQRRWWQPKIEGCTRLLLPLSAIYRVLFSWGRSQGTAAARREPRLPRPVIVVGNLIVGGAGKTPTTIALVQALKTAGWHPGVVSRGYGRNDPLVPREVTRHSSAEECGDEPLLIHLRTGAPVMVDRNRHAAGLALLERHPDVDVIVADDGLQHWKLLHDLSLIVFDRRGAGNGHVLPAGPLREPLPSRLPHGSWVIYNADEPTTPLLGHCAERGLAGAVPLQDWWTGTPPSMDSLELLQQENQRGTPTTAMAGIAEPERFFQQLESLGFRIRRHPLVDHASMADMEWPVDEGLLLITEKDAVKLQPDLYRSKARHQQCWVITLDFRLPTPLTQAILDALAPLKNTRSIHDR
jgi:tetraacyldisaccharide 4'-kinase